MVIKQIMASKTADFEKKLQDFKARLKTEAPAPAKKKAKKKERRKMPRWFNKKVELIKK